MSSKEPRHGPSPSAAALIAVLALTACKDSENLTAPSGTLPGGNLPGGQSGGGDTTSTPGDTTSNPVDTTGAGDPVTNGTWTTPDTTTIDPVDPGVYDPTETGTAGTSGSSTALVFKTSGSGLYGVGTCSGNGFWTDPAGNVFGPHNPNCLDYGSDGSPGTGGKGQCIASASGQPGLWVNPGGQETHPFHSKCIRTGDDDHLAGAHLRAPGADLRRQRRVGQSGDELLLVGDRRGAAALRWRDEHDGGQPGSWWAATTRRRRTPGRSSSGSRR